MAKVSIFPDPHFLAITAADHFISACGAAIEARGLFSVALSGGSTPLMLYRLLASEAFRERVDWARVHIFWGDERCVPPDHADSNYANARRALLDHVPVPPEQVYRIQAEQPPEQAAQAYEDSLRRFFADYPGETHTFDLVLLGMGDDGHTASLFPGLPAVHEQEQWVTAQYVDKLAAWRISLTPAVLNLARKVIFMAAGPGKRETLQKVIYGTQFPERYPAQAIRPLSGDLEWLVDEAAAALF